MTIPAIVVDSTTLGLIITSATLIIRDIIKSKKGNPTKLPCSEHSNKIIAIEATQKVRNEWLEEFKEKNTEEHNQLSEKLDLLNGKYR
jgi:hypothetical protein